MIWPAEALVQSVIGSLTGAFFPKDLLLDARSQWILTSVLGRTLGFGDSAFSRLPKVLTPIIVRSSRSVPFLLVLREVTKMPERNWSTSLCPSAMFLLCLIVLSLMKLVRGRHISLNRLSRMENWLAGVYFTLLQGIGKRFGKWTAFPPRTGFGVRCA